MRVDTQVQSDQLSVESVAVAVEVFRMLADPTRVRLLHALRQGERSVNEIATLVGKPASGVSQHLAKLRLARLVRSRRQGNQIFYRVDSDHVRQLVTDAIHHAEHASQDHPDHHRAAAVVDPARDRSRH